MDQDRLQALGRSEAQRWETAGLGSTGLWRVRLAGDRRALAGVCKRLGRRREELECPGLDWLLDNQYLVRESIRRCEQSLRRCGRLPLLHTQGGLFRLQRAAMLLTRQEALEPDRVLAFLAGVQSVTPLMEEELFQLPAALVSASASLLRRSAEELEQALDRGGETERAGSAIRGQVQRLAKLRELELGTVLEQASAVETIFREDPAGVYAGMDEYSRHAYRQRLVKLARRERVSQSECARRVVELARQEGGHIGTWLFRRPLGRERKPIHSGWYVSLLLALTTALSILIGFALGRWWAILLFLFPVSELVKNTVDLLLLHFVPPRPVFRMELKWGIPEAGKTLCVIASLLTGEEAVEELCGKLERYYLANRRAGSQVGYGLLADLPDRRREMNEQDEALLAQCVKRLGDLTSRYGERFFLFFRRPCLVEAEGTYRGRERKRGAILALARYLRSRRGELELRWGKAGALAGTQFLMVLDSDTVLTMDALTELAGTMLHPLNTPVLDTKRRIVTQGYGILQPRVETELSRSARSVFSRLFSGIAGLDPYGGAVSDLYHDLFDQGTFMGKGLLHIDAFLTCMEGRFPENRILSHDLLEGSYLRCGWVSRTELLDSFPSGALSWLSRYHRWIRGDWQIGNWILRRVRDEEGRYERNPIPMLARWKVFDNLRRSLVPPATLAALLAGLLGTGPLFLSALLAALLTALSEVITAAVELAWRRGQGSFRRYHAGIYAGLTGSALRSGAELLFLPVQAWTAFHAAVLALWRMTVGHRHLLDWVTSGQSSQGGQGLARYVRRFWFSLGTGFGVMVFSPFPAGRILGLCWAVSPLLFCRWGMTEDRQNALPQRERAFLLHEAALIWRYYQSWLRPEYHYLIPDNVQSMPDRGAAERTSPTNIGLSLLACLAALDLNLTERRQAVELIGRQLEALETLERWRGHFFNWYDITTAQPLNPRYVSTVDSGNLCACLIALSGGLEELGETALAQRSRTLAEEMDFSLLYDARRGLFYIGYDTEQGSYSPSHYDLMASEARTTSYLAIARGEVPPRHWRRLSRAIVRRNRYTGMASWSGTMFEYLMPHLLLPVCPDSLMGESLSFCVDQQRRAGFERGTVWGVSESAFYELDLGQNFQYKAHGIPALTVKNEPGEEQVVAPYACFLALGVKPRAAAANLRRMRDMGAEGTYGLYEALDFTPSRGGERTSPLPVRSWMAHHLGMSLLAVDNCLTGEPMVRRFFSDVRMAAAEELLMEKIPVGEAVVRRSPSLRIPTPRRRTVSWQRSGTGYDPEDPVWGIAANENYAVTLSAAGAGESRTGKWTVLHPDGVQVFLRRDGVMTQVFPCPGADRCLQWEYRSGYACLTWQGEGFTLRQQVLVDAQHNGEQRTFTLTADEDWEGELCVLLRPVLDMWEGYEAHPAFSRMCVESAYVGGGVRFTRRPGRNALTPVLTVLWEQQEAAWSTNREAYLTARSIRHSNRQGVVLDPCAALELPVKLAQGEKRELKLALAVGGSEDSFTAAQALLSLRRPAPSPLTDRLAGAKGADSVDAAFALLSRLRSPGDLGEEGTPQGQSALWRFGISGDLSIVTCRVSSGQWEQAVALAGVHEILRRLGVPFDLVLLVFEQGDYLQTQRGGLLRTLQRRGYGAVLNRDGGIRLLTGSEEDWRPVLGMAAVNLRPGDKLAQSNAFTCPAALRRERVKLLASPDWHWQRRGFVLETQGELPPVRWSHFLVNESLGWRCDEAGTGHLWLGNAHLGQLTGWGNDPTALTGPEELVLCRNGQEHSLFARRGDGKSVVTYGCGYARWERILPGLNTTLTAFVPREGAVRVWKVELGGTKPGDTLRWRLHPRLSRLSRHEGWVRFATVEGGCALDNPAGTLPGVVLELLGSVEPVQVQWHAGAAELVFPAAETMVLTAGVQGAYDRRLLLDTEEVFAASLRWWAQRTAALSVKTPDEGLNHYLSFWGPYQVLAGRVLGRNGLYQCGGAVGFRDQLQDVLALLPFCPEITRRQLLDCAAHQFREGDVLHWWHNVPGEAAAQGVRTRISDDLLWLPYALCRWTQETGDTALLREQTPYLEGQALRPEEAERYQQWSPGQERHSLYRHGVQAIECVLNRGVGEHGLCRMGTGDWNDGMNRIGAKGRGESVWLTWFLSLILSRFAPLCDEMGEPQRGERYRSLSARLARQGEQCWDGAWYLRAFDDEGRPLGGQGAEECAIDSVAQSFAVFALGAEERPRQAVLSAAQRLYDREHQLVRLLYPPFSGKSDPGYVRGYPEGLRENGGQYTHAACWLALALLRTGEGELAWRMLHDLLPEHHPAPVYCAEPYVLAGDVYAAEGQMGRGGWSWYTGAAGWYCQTVMRELLGLRLEGGRLMLRPNLPRDWPGYQAQWQGEGFSLSIVVERGEQPSLTLDGAPVDEGLALSQLSGAHQLRLIMKK